MQRLSKTVQHAAGFVVVLAALTAAFWRPLGDLARYAARRDLYSHIFLVPPICGYLVYQRRKDIFHDLRIGPVAALLLGLAAAAALIVQAAIARHGNILHPNDHLSLTGFSFAVFVMAAFALFFGRRAFREAAAPLLFLLLLAPMPVVVVHSIETILQYLSAEALHGLFKLTGTPVLRDGLVFALPGLTIQVARECSGIRSTFVLFITSLLAGVLCLRTTSRRAWLILSVIPIAAYRNAVRILVIALLTVHVNPNIIRGPIHRQGGPPFFALSLVPLFAILIAFHRSERKSERRDAAAGGPENRI